ncbi:MAG TPA: uroporphyrinogen-III C-methyltransferase [Candidatus Sulfotelmatobacter sp.]|nr:uroporphyrinogen-III C-methyltransferase [Candidatus Sulfotelmatobacter sp.]
MKGKVYLVGAGPGDPDLLTVKASRLLQMADVVLHDDLVSPEILRQVSPAALVQNVGKRCGIKSLQQEEINFLMIELANTGRTVIRLKSGDPMIFGRAGEEIEALRRAEVSYEVVPGVTSALGAAASAEIPLTDRRLSSAVVFVTAHRADDAGMVNWEKLAASGATLVIYMPGKNYSALASNLAKAGVASDTPCAIVSRATTSQQQTYQTSVGDLAGAAQLSAPSLVLVGEVVRLADVNQLQEIAQSVPERSGVTTYIQNAFASAAEEPVE